MTTEYAKAYAEWKTEAAAWTKAQQDYRARKIGDDEFLKARKRFKDADKVFDEAESKEKERTAMNRNMVAQELVRIAKGLMALEFDTEAEKRKYEQEHDVRPGTKLTVKPSGGEKSTGKSERDSASSHLDSVQSAIRGNSKANREFQNVSFFWNSALKAKEGGRGAEEVVEKASRALSHLHSTMHNLGKSEADRYADKFLKLEGAINEFIDNANDKK